ncbi:nucleotide pyrophosphohydrolase [Enterococcus quebecensis]|uniref:Nucleotide pyrophosphohydrolase n=1 Tax=Enterococcus quebecensis TaxID=903983 RepID=A0A1E5GXB0_9ENTE|nr:nucleotide pyrophosphohydrolase [Enterococcus quebecensis]OEG17307.1 nucleotide pyrophosphohydrolase [Enterococcus quebecensis]
MDKLTEKINQFRDAREWRQFHNPKDLAISISLEASELLENFQWNTSEEAKMKSIENIEQELADVFIYSLMLASDLELNVEKIINDKLELNAQKYPIEKSRGIKKKYTEF